MAAAMPSRPGIEMSVTITSGDRAFALDERPISVPDARDHLELRLEQSRTRSSGSSAWSSVRQKAWAYHGVAHLRVTRF